MERVEASKAVEEVHNAKLRKERDEVREEAHATISMIEEERNSALERRNMELGEYWVCRYGERALSVVTQVVLCETIKDPLTVPIFTIGKGISMMPLGEVLMDKEWRSKVHKGAKGQARIFDGSFMSWPIYSFLETAAASAMCMLDAVKKNSEADKKTVAILQHDSKKKQVKDDATAQEQRDSSES